MADYSVDIQASLKGFEKLDEYERKINELSNKKVQVQFDAKGIDNLLKGVGSNSGANIGVKVGQQIGSGIQKGISAVDFSKNQQKIRDNIQKTSNEIQKMTLKMAVPEGIKCIIKSVEDVTTILDDPRSESMRLMVLVPTVKDAVTLCKRYKNIEMVNIGNAGKMTSGEKKILSKEVMLTADELEALKELTELYPDTFFQGTPAMEKKMASAILKGC